MTKHEPNRRSGNPLFIIGALRRDNGRRRPEANKPRLVLAAVAAIMLSSVAVAQLPAYPAEGYSPLLFDPIDAKYVFRLNGTPWICQGDTFCKPIKIDGAADKDLAQAAIEPLGFAGQRYFLSFKHANFEKGKSVALTCLEERCGKLDSTTGPTSLLGTFQAKDGERVVTRAAILRQLDARNGRAQLLWCGDTGCAELPLTRDNETYLAYMGTGPKDGHNVAWLRDKSGAVVFCSQPEEGISDQLICEKSQIVLADFPTAATQTTMPAPPAPPAALSDADRNALAASIDRAITAGDFIYADRLLADANRRYARNAAWPPLQQRLAKARADRDLQLRQAEARRLIAEAWRFAQVGDFFNAEAMLQEADNQMPRFAETAQARSEIAALRTERGQRYRERYQYYAAIDQAFTGEQLWEVERLLAEYAQRFNQDNEYRSRSSRLAQMRAAATWQARIDQARGFIANARQAMTRGDFAEAERQLVRADRAAPGFPEINQARADLSRRRIAAERQQDDLRLILAAIDAALQRRQYDDAERAIEDGRRRYGSYPGWTDLQRRSASARQGNDRQANELRAQNARALELVAAARRSTAQGDFAAAERALNEATAVSANMPEIAIARADLERAKADRARQDAEIRALAASVDAALARKQYADAERLIAIGTKRYPSHAGWADLSRRLAEERRATPTQTGNAPMPAQPAPAPTPPAAPIRPGAVTPPAAPAPATANVPPTPPTANVPPTPPAPPPGPATVTPPAAPAPATANAPAPATVPAVNPRLPQLVTAAREAIKRADLAAAEKAVADAEKIDAKAASVVEVRAELRLAQSVATARRAIRRSDVAGAEKAVADAEQIDAKAASVVEVRAELRVLQFVTTARQAIKRADFAAAAVAIAEAEKINAKAASVVEVRAELKDAEEKSKKKTPPATRN